MINDDRRIYSRDEIGLIGTDRNTVLRSDIAGPVSHMTIFNDSTISYSIDFHEITKFQHIENISDSIYISNDFGNHWKKINDNIKILSVMGYDSSYVFYTGRVNEKNQWFISDFHSGDTDIYDYRNTFNAQADDGMLANYTNFYKYRDGQLKQISRFVWTKEKWFFSYGSCNTQFLAKNGELVIAFANQFPGKEGEEYCIFYSTDEGMTWSPIAIGRNLFLARFNQIPASKIPGEEGLTVIYQKGNSDSLHKITIRRRDL